MEEKTLKKGPFTLTSLSRYLNSEFKKENGAKFTISDTQGYATRGRLPFYLGGNVLKKLKQDEYGGSQVYEILETKAKRYAERYSK